MTAWTEAEMATLKQGCADRLSYAMIARSIPGKTRNACIGRAKRMGLDNGIPSGVYASVTRKPRPPCAFKTRLVPIQDHSDVSEPVPVGILPSRRLTLMKLTDQTCKFSTDGDDGASFLFCGNETEPERSYCRGHCLVCFAPAVRR